MEVAVERIERGGIGVEVCAVEIDGAEVLIAVRRVVINPGVGVAARGVDGFFAEAIVQANAAADHGDVLQDMEEVGDVLLFVGRADAVCAGKGGADEAGGGRGIPGQADGAHAATVRGKGEGFRKSIDGFIGREIDKVVEPLELNGEGRVIGKDADGILINFQAVFGGFGDDGSGAIRDEPMERGDGQAVAEGEVDEVDIFEQRSCFGKIRAGEEEIGNKFKGGEVDLALDLLKIDGVFREVEAGGAEAVFIDGVVEERHAVFDDRHADHGLMICERFFHAEIPI